MAAFSDPSVQALVAPEEEAEEEQQTLIEEPELVVAPEEIDQVLELSASRADSHQQQAISDGCSGVCMSHACVRTGEASWGD